MRASDLLGLLGRLRDSAYERFGPEGLVAINALCEAAVRFGDRPIAEFASKLAVVKPTASRKAAGTKPLRTNLVEKYAGQLRDAFGDPRATAEIVSRIRADRSALQPEVVAIAKALGIRATSKTAKGAALTQIEGLAAQRERDAQLAERIRKGA